MGGVGDRYVCAYRGRITTVVPTVNRHENQSVIPHLARRIRGAELRLGDVGGLSGRRARRREKGNCQM